LVYRQCTLYTINITICYAPLSQVEWTKLDVFQYTSKRNLSFIASFIKAINNNYFFCYLKNLCTRQICIRTIIQLYTKFSSIIILFLLRAKKNKEIKKSDSSQWKIKNIISGIVICKKNEYLTIYKISR